MSKGKGKFEKGKGVWIQMDTLGVAMGHVVLDSYYVEVRNSENLFNLGTTSLIIMSEWLDMNIICLLHE